MRKVIGLVVLLSMVCAVPAFALPCHDLSGKRVPIFPKPNHVHINGPRHEIEEVSPAFAECKDWLGDIVNGGGTKTGKNNNPDTLLICGTLTKTKGGIVEDGVVIVRFG